MSESKKFIENISSNYFIFAVRILLGIYALPVCLHAYGAEQYGLYIICFGLSSAMAAFDFGSSKSIFRYTIEYNADQNSGKYQEAISAGISFNFYAAFVIAIFMLAIGFFSDTLFNISSETAKSSLLLFSLAAINSFLITLDAVPQNILTANKHFLIRNKYQLAIIGLNLLIVLGIQFTNLITLNIFAALTTLTTLLTLLCDLYLVSIKKLLKGLSIKLLSGKSIFSTPYSGYSMQVFLLSLISFMAVQADRFIIASVLDVASVTIYTIITKPYFVLRGVTSISFPVIQPMLTRLNLEKDKTAYFNFTGKVIRTAFLFMLSITLLTAIFYNQVLTLWLGTDIYNIYIKWGILSLAGLCISMLYTPFYRTLLHSNYIRIIVKFSLISVLINVILSITLSKLLGFQGVIIGTLVQIICEFIFSYTLFYKKFEYPVKFTKINKGFLLLVVCLIAIAFGINYLVANYAHNLTLQAILFVGFLGLLSFISYKIIKTENIFGQFSSVQHKPASDIVT